MYTLSTIQNEHTTLRIDDLDNLKSVWLLDLGLMTIFANAPKILQTSKVVESGHKWPKNTHPTTFTKVQSKSLINPLFLSFETTNSIIVTFDDKF